MTTPKTTTRKRVVVPQIEALPGMTPLGLPEPKVAAKTKAVEKMADEALTKQAKLDAKAAAKPKALPKLKEAKAPKLKTLRVKANGVTAPRADGVSGQLWSFFDGIVAKGGTATTADAKAFAAEAKLNPTTATLALGYWRKFNGVAATGNQPKPKVAKEPKPKEAKAEGKLDLTDEVLAYCASNYENGWCDLVVETVERADLAKALAGAKTLNGAVRKAKALVATVADVRADIVAA